MTDEVPEDVVIGLRAEIGNVSLVGAFSSYRGKCSAAMLASRSSKPDPSFGMVE